MSGKENNEAHGSNAAKRLRSLNWDDIEKDIFIELMREEINILENKKKLTTCNRDKNNAWKRISEKMEVEGYMRDVTRLKQQWQRMKVQSKKNISNYRRMALLTGGGPPVAEPNEIDYKIKDLIPQEFVEDDNPFDCDAAPLRTPTVVNLVEIPIQQSPSIDNYQLEGEITEIEITEIDQPSNVLMETEDEQPVVETPSTRNELRKSKCRGKQLTLYEQKLLALNEKRMEQIMRQSDELHTLKMQNESQLHEIRLKHEKELHAKNLKK